MVEKIIDRAITSLRANGVEINREQWIQVLVCIPFLEPLVCVLVLDCSPTVQIIHSLPTLKPTDAK